MCICGGVWGGVRKQMYEKNRNRILRVRPPWAPAPCRFLRPPNAVLRLAFVCPANLTASPSYVQCPMPHPKTPRVIVASITNDKHLCLSFFRLEYLAPTVASDSFHQSNLLHNA